MQKCEEFQTTGAATTNHHLLTTTQKRDISGGTNDNS
jgi:hypothetical protein